MTLEEAYQRGRDAGLREAIAVVAQEPNFKGPMPLRDRLWATIFPCRSARAAGAAWRSSVLAKLRALLGKKTA